MTEREMIEIEKHWCENCCNWDKEKIQMDGYSDCKLTGTTVFGQEYGGDCKCFNIPAENVIVPSCKVGQKVYVIHSTVERIEMGLKDCIYETVVDAIHISGTIEYHLYYKKIVHPDCDFFTEKDIGKIVFFTKEEAEAKLKEGSKNE